eukprot:s2113_g5.t1
MVHDDSWFEVCQGLIAAGICKVVPRHALHHVGDTPLLNGLFSVSKNEFSETGVELHRLIMNMVPVNKLCRSLKGDVGTLPTLAGLSAFYLEDTEVAVLSSEDIKCFYYLFKLPTSWHKFMGFAKEVPPGLVPKEFVGEPCHLTALVLPMGFLNSVGIAQHVHRNLVRLPMVPQVTASDASSTGGGLSCSIGLTDFGVAAQAALVRGELPEPLEYTEVLTVGLFDGIGALRVAADALHLPMAGHISVECNAYANNKVLESAFPGSRHVASVQEVTPEEVTRWACEYSSVGVILLGAGPRCQGVSQLNVDRKGSQRDERSSLYKEIPRVANLLKAKFPWAQVHTFVESVASMDAVDRAAMSGDLELLPNRVDSVGVSLARRPRLYWCTWALVDEAGLKLMDYEGLGWKALREISLEASVDQRLFLQAGWFLPPGFRLATFTTSRPSDTPGRRPAGLHTCDSDTVARWKDDLHRYPPYQYKPEYGVHHSNGEVRVPSILEREVILGFPAHYTSQCVPKVDRKAEWVDDVRKTLLGNSWSVPVVCCLLKQLFERLGVIPFTPVQTLVDRLAPGNALALQAVLQRPPIHRETARVHPEDGLARRLSGLVSIKGEDLLLQATSEQTIKYHRLRSSIPSRLWKWREVAGWAWQTPGDHINQLEMRAVLTSAKCWIQKRRLRNCKLLHLTDSLVVNEIPCRAPPLPERVLQALVGYFIFKHQPQMALSLLLGFYSMLRTGELLGIRARDVTVDVSHGNAVVSLHFTKGGKRTGAAESVTVTVSEVIRRLSQWKKHVSPGSNLTPPPHTWRKNFAAALSALHLEKWEFRPYSLRRGGATFWFAQHGSLDRILLQGRWMAAKTARICLLLDGNDHAKALEITPARLEQLCAEHDKAEDLCTALQELTVPQKVTFVRVDSVNVEKTLQLQRTSTAPPVVADQTTKRW